MSCPYKIFKNPSFLVSISQINYKILLSVENIIKNVKIDISCSFCYLQNIFKNKNMVITQKAQRYF
ncbi:hypothetical protein CVT91_14340 [Candidatus Atribacteria bacterium HGW-Atribacteria-1]|nr:MAG: hypothetical protein CVT91_14340 [Candidatus Atribacteria bacterium HGW-Atribacteria-1]